MVRTAGTLRLLAVVLAAVVALSLVPGPADAVVRGEPDIDAFVVNDAVAPGEDATLRFTLVNRGDVTVGSAADRTLADQVTTARAVEVTLDEGRAPLTVRSPTRAIGRFPVGEEPAVAFNVSVAPDAEPGTYVVHLRLEYTHTSVIAEETGSQQDRTVHDTVDVEIQVADRPRFEARAVATNVSVGDTGRLALTLRNVGSATARDASVTLSSPDADLAFGAGEPSSTSFVGTWRPGETRRVESRVSLPDAALVRDYRVTAVVTYTDEDGVERRSDPVEVGVVPRPEQTFAVGNVTSTLRVGEKGTLSGRLRNDGPDPVRDAVVTLASPDANRTGGVTEFPVGDLAPGEARPFRFRVTLPPGADPVPRAFDLVVTYHDPDGNQRRSDPLPVNATVSPQRDQFRVTPVNATVEVDGDATLVVGVTNDGDRPVTNVSAALSAAEPLESEDPVAYAGALDPGERTTVRFALSATDEAIPKTSLVTLNLSYEDADGDRAISGPYSVPVEVVEPVGPGLPVLPLVAVVAALVVAVWWWRYRR